MTYLHDIFVSYKREKNWTPWVRDHFVDLLTSYMQQELGRSPSIFVDERIPVGSDQAQQLGENLARSKVLLAIFSADYFGSDWCVHELDLMLGRSGVPGSMVAPRQIIPTVVHDGNLIPDPVRQIQPRDFSAWRIAHINRNSPVYQDFSVAMRDLAPHIRQAIELAPPFDPTWINVCEQRFDDVFRSTTVGSRLLPTHLTLIGTTPTLTPPRIIV
jgi:hypothetical protein